MLNDLLLLRQRGQFCVDLQTVPWRRCFGSAFALFNSLSVCLLRRMSGGCMPETTGRDGVGVDFRQPVTIRIVAFSAMSTLLV